MPPTALIVPCYNEAHRLDRERLVALAPPGAGIVLWLVDDGSTDATYDILRELAAATPSVRILRLDRNAGKAEAIRAGLRAALADGAGLVGYCDADLATPPDEMLRLVRIATESPALVVMGSRVRLLGRRIERQPSRHYLGRIFATLASLALRLPVYDTQCGAKLFRASPALARALASPFRTRWIFDVELLSRLTDGAEDGAVREEQLLEVPLRVWHDVGGSKLRPRAMLRAGLQLLALLVRSRLRPRRRAP